MLEGPVISVLQRSNLFDQGKVGSRARHFGRVHAGSSARLEVPPSSAVSVRGSPPSGSEHPLHERTLRTNRQCPERASQTVQENQGWWVFAGSSLDHMA